MAFVLLGHPPRTSWHRLEPGRLHPVLATQPGTQPREPPLGGHDSRRRHSCDQQLVVLVANRLGGVVCAVGHRLAGFPWRRNTENQPAEATS